jgi:formylglycine-generating enzyme required for sulfatase activity
MSSLADLPEVIGFFSYSREDDESYKGRLSGLREAIQHELSAQLGRSKATFRLWQDKEAIAPGKLWEEEIKTAVGQCVFFIPIVTPRAVNSDYCKFEFEAFLARERALGRADLVFPILYVPVPALASETRWRDHPVLSIIGKRQYVDWQTFRHADAPTPAMREEIARFCNKIVEALQQTWLTPEERRRQEEAQAQARAQEERRRQEAEAKHRAEEEARRQKEEEERRRREEEAEQRRKTEAEEIRRQEEHARKESAEADEKRREEQRARDEAEATRRAEIEERRQRQRLQGRASSRWSRPALLAFLVGAAVVGAIGVWFAIAPSPPGPAPSPTPAPTAAPAPVTPAPTQTADAPLLPQIEQALKPKDTFTECADCPEMIVVPAGRFTMGSPAREPGRDTDEGPQHTVTLARQFAVATFALTFDEWDACVADGGCNGYQPSDQGWGRGRRPVVDVSWDDAKAYVTWLSRKTGKTYRLLSEAEYEYAARAGTTFAYPWGGAIGKNNANCESCGSQWDKKQTAPVGSFAANGFGLYDMVGNVWAWTEDCAHENYNGAPTDGSAWTSGDCKYRVVRGGSWFDSPRSLRSASRNWITAGRYVIIGFRVGRALLAP